jgi:glycosyltransferase involved in cell wall biosynthesis
MRGENIVCFAKDWSEDPTSNNHVMKLIARDNRVLWLNSISTRSPTLGARDVRKVVRKVGEFAAGPREGSPGLHTFTPLVFPFPHSRVFRGVNRALLRATVRRLRRRLGMGRFQLWSFVPTAADFVGRLGEEISVYYCTDEWSEFRHVDGPRIAEMDRTLCTKADIVFATSRLLEERRRALNPETHLVSHGVDREHFAQALTASAAPPADVAAIPEPRLGFFGLIEAWIDTELLAEVARRRPDWSLVLIGRAHVDTSELAALPNVHLLGRRPYAELPAYARSFAVGLCPFRVNELTRNVNPIKLREYLSAGLPVVSTDIPECRVPEGQGRVALGAEAFVDAVAKVLAEDTPAARLARSEAMRSETWESRIEHVGRNVLRVRDARRSRAEAAAAGPRP